MVNISSFESQKILSSRGCHFLADNEQNILWELFHCCKSCSSLTQGKKNASFFYLELEEGLRNK